MKRLSSSGYFPLPLERSLNFLLRTLTFLCLSAIPSFAADGAQSNAIGFSPDGKYFAFEQYGQQDGSGFSYWDVFVLDVAADKWVPDTPVRILDETEGTTLAAVRKKAWTKAGPIIETLKIERPVDTLVHMPATELDQKRQQVRFVTYYNSMGLFADEAHMPVQELSVKAIPLPVPADCTDTDIAMPMGMEVTLRDVQKGKTVTVSKDTKIPASRGCAHDYDIEAVFAPAGWETGNDPLIALIGVYSRGFEGSDRRFIAVPFELIE